MGTVAPRLAHSRCLPPGASARWRMSGEQVDWVSLDALVKEDAGLMARLCEADGDPVSAAEWRELAADPPDGEADAGTIAREEREHVGRLGGARGWQAAISVWEKPEQR